MQELVRTRKKWEAMTPLFKIWTPAALANGHGERARLQLLLSIQLEDTDTTSFTVWLSNTSGCISVFESFVSSV